MVTILLHCGVGEDEIVGSGGEELFLGVEQRLQSDVLGLAAQVAELGVEVVWSDEVGRDLALSDEMEDAVGDSVDVVEKRLGSCSEKLGGMIPSRSIKKRVELGGEEIFDMF